MPLKLSWNALTLRNDLTALFDAQTPHLDKAKILTASVGGKPVPISEASPLDRFNALMAVNPVAENKQGDSDLIVTNADLAARLEKAESDLAVANGTIGGLQNKVRDLETRATTAESTVQTMTAERTQKDLEANSLRTENARITREQVAANAALSVKALSLGCLLDLKDAAGNILPSTASAVDKQAAAERVPFTAKLDALGGVCANALQRLGVPSGNAPATPPAGSAASAPKMSRSEFFKLSPDEQTNFFKLKGQFTD